MKPLVLRHTASKPFTEFEGGQFGVGASFILVQTAKPGVGPELHQHPYAESFVIHSGRTRFTVGSKQMIGVAGQIIIGQAFIQFLGQWIRDPVPATRTDRELGSSEKIIVPTP